MTTTPNSTARSDSDLNGGGAGREPNYAADMNLPEGLTCADCQHGLRCDALFGAVRKGFTSCDFWPSRFLCNPVATADSSNALPPMTVGSNASACHDLP